MPPDVPEATCPLCGRPLGKRSRVERHHLVPKGEGGRTVVRMHRICHRKLHSLFAERERATRYADFAALLTHPDIRRFVAWVRRRQPEFEAPTAPARSRRSRRHPRRC